MQVVHETLQKPEIFRVTLGRTDQIGDALMFIVIGSAAVGDPLLFEQWGDTVQAVQIAHLRDEQGVVPYVMGVWDVLGQHHKYTRIHMCTTSSREWDLEVMIRTFNVINFSHSFILVFAIYLSCFYSCYYFFLFLLVDTFSLTNFTFNNHKIYKACDYLNRKRNLIKVKLLLKWWLETCFCII